MSGQKQQPTRPSPLPVVANKDAHSSSPPQRSRHDPPPERPASSSSSSVGQTLGIFFSSGDLGDVGRHAVLAALELPSFVVSSIRVFSRDLSPLDLPNWKCGGKCAARHADITQQKRVQLVQLDCATATSDEIETALLGVHAVVSCLGSRQPFHKERIVRQGTERLVQASLKCHISRFVMISSVGIADDWPPMHWSQEGRVLEGFFRTICWRQYQDLTAAEMATRQGAIRNPAFDFLIVRPVVLSEHGEPVGSWRIQTAKHEEHPTSEISKMDCARLMIIEAIYPSLSQRAVVLGGDVTYETHTTYEDFAALKIPFF